MKLYYVLLRHKATQGTTIPSYYDGLSVFTDPVDARVRCRTLRRKFPSHSWDLRILPWHSEMGEVDIFEMWRSALSPSQVS